jgi:hypothetical protein
VPYVVPQEHGDKTGLRWLELMGQAAAVRFIPSEPCEGSATRFTPDDLFAARHSLDLTPRAEVIVNLDVRQRGSAPQLRARHSGAVSDRRRGPHPRLRDQALGAATKPIVSAAAN